MLGHTEAKGAQTMNPKTASGNLHPTEGYVVLPRRAIEMEAEIRAFST